jgi:hypothetical protein
MKRQVDEARTPPAPGAWPCRRPSRTGRGAGNRRFRTRTPASCRTNGASRGSSQRRPGGGSFATPGECSRSYRAGKTEPDLDERSPSRCSDSLVDRVEHRALISTTLAPRSRSPWTPIAASCRGCRGVRPTHRHRTRRVMAATWRQRSASGRAAGGVSAARLHSALVAQWREQRFPKPRVAGSIPAEGTRSTCGNALPGEIEEGVVAVTLPSARQSSSSWSSSSRPSFATCDVTNVS